MNVTRLFSAEFQPDRLVRDEESKVVNQPILMLKPECVEAAKIWWANTQGPISKAPHDYWEPFLTERE